MNTLVFGETGQVATELAFLDGITCFGRDMADLSNPQACADIITKGDYDAVINAAAYTAVDKAESEEALATLINGDAPTAMAKTCVSKNIPFVHISTDYVFEGNGEAPWKPADPTKPQNAYGRSKLKGEQGVIAAGGTYAIMRTSWVFSAHGNNFVKTMLRLGAERDVLNIVGDQIGGPTDARSIAKAAHVIATQLASDTKKSGVYHFSGAPDCSWADFATDIFTKSGLNCNITAIPTKDYPTPASRPLNSRMDCETTSQVFGILCPDWRETLTEVLGDIA